MMGGYFCIELKNCITKGVIGFEEDHVMLSIREALISFVMAEGCESFSLKTDSITDSSVEVVSCPETTP